MADYLILGGARSGKSRLAENLVKRVHAENEKSRLHYVATAIAFDSEMETRIQEHKMRRGDEWIEHECPTELAALIRGFQFDDIVLIDCLTVWLNNVIYNDGNDITQPEIQDKVKELIDALSDTKASCVFVSNEVGLGIVPLGKVTRLFVDNAGWMNQGIASVIDNVILVAAGIPMALKGSI